MNNFNLILLSTVRLAARLTAPTYPIPVSVLQALSHKLGLMKCLICALLSSFCLSMHREVAHANTPTERHACMTTQQDQDCLQQPRGLIVTFTYCCLGIMLGVGWVGVGGWDELLLFSSPYSWANPDENTAEKKPKTLKKLLESYKYSIVSQMWMFRSWTVFNCVWISTHDWSLCLFNLGYLSKSWANMGLNQKFSVGICDMIQMYGAGAIWIYLINNSFMLYRADECHHDSLTVGFSFRT